MRGRDRDIVAAERLDAGTRADRREAEDRDVAGGGQGLCRTVEANAIHAPLGRRARSRRDDAVRVGRALQGDAAVGRGDRAVDTHADDAVRAGAIRRREGDIAQHGRTGRRQHIQGIGRRVAVSVEPDIAGRRQVARSAHEDAITTAGDRSPAIAITGDREAADRRSAARRDRRVEFDAGDTAAIDDDITQGRYDRAISINTDGADHAFQACGADQDIAGRGQRGGRSGAAEARRLAAGHGRPGSRRRDSADEGGPLQGDAAARGRDRSGKIQGVVAGAAAGVGRDDHVAAERRADRRGDRHATCAGGGISRERDGARGAERGRRGRIQAVTVRTRRRDRQGPRVHARAGRDGSRQAHGVETGARQGDVAIAAEDVAEEVSAHEGHAGPGDGDIA